MDRFYPSQSFVTIFKTIEQYPIRSIFISKRLYNLIIKKSNKGTWAFVMFTVVNPIENNYQIVMVSPQTRAIYSIKN